MKNISQFLDKKNITKRALIDEKSIFYVFQSIIKEEYGRQGQENIKPSSFRERKIFIKAGGSNWASEIWLKRGEIVKKMNEQLGGEEIVDLALVQ
jgi:hypothetical protein